MKNPCLVLLTGCVLLFLATSLQAVNICFLAGDAAFYCSPGKEKLEALLTNTDPKKEVLIRYERLWGGLTLCGYTGTSELRITETPREVKQLIKAVLADDSMWLESDAAQKLKEEKQSAFTVSTGPRFIFCSPEFDLRNNSLFTHNNADLKKQLKKHNVFKKQIPAILKHQSDIKVSKEFPPPLALHSMEANCDFSDTTSAKLPDEYQIIVMPINSQSKKCYQLLNGVISEFDLSEIASSEPR